MRRPAFSDYTLIAAGFFVIFIIPEIPLFPTGCIFNRITGFYCAGCGMSRGIHALLRSDFYSAAHRNLLLVSAIPLSAFWIFLRYIILKKNDKIKKYDLPVIIFFISIVIIFTILRNNPSSIFNFLRPL